MKKNNKKIILTNELFFLEINCFRFVFEQKHTLSTPKHESGKINWIIKFYHARFFLGEGFPKIRDFGIACDLCLISYDRKIKLGRALRRFGRAPWLTPPRPIGWTACPLWWWPSLYGGHLPADTVCPSPLQSRNTHTQRQKKIQLCDFSVIILSIQNATLLRFFSFCVPYLVSIPSLKWGASEMHTNGKETNVNATKRQHKCSQKKRTENTS